MNHIHCWNWEAWEGNMLKTLVLALTVLLAGIAEHSQSGLG
jgi:hypothetical protein